MKHKKLLAFLFIAAVLASCTGTKHTHEKNPDWEENFNRLNGFDTGKWSKIPRGTSDWDRHMSNFDSCYAMRDGRLILRGINNTTVADDTSKYLTGGVYTKDKVSFGSGRLEIRARLNGATGVWPAFWLLGQGEKYPGGGEIDIMEHLNYDSIVYQTVHSYYTITLNIKNDPPHGGIARIHANEFNTYAVEKYRDSIVFYVNDKRTFAYPRIQTDKKDQFPFAGADHYLLLDMQLGGSWVGKIDPADLPVEMEIDWVKFYAFKQKPPHD
ncbi:MAG TPA: glycoside hydrolase family 16 protein [Parafilimonas sp.]|nr:glycoside hydrolase family 16 protein [Parafilimonas sp.]